MLEKEQASLRRKGLYGRRIGGRRTERQLLFVCECVDPLRMHYRVVVRSIVFILVVGGLCGPGGDAWAQNNQFTQRSFLASPVVRGMGDAGVALPGREQGFFYNPAHLPATESHFTIIGAQASATTSLRDHVQFLNERLNPVVEDNFERSDQVIAALERDADQLRRRPSRGHGGVILPAFVYSQGAFGIGGGLFAKTAVNYRIERDASEELSVWALNRTDLMGLVSMGLNLGWIGLEGLSLGVTGTRTRRFVSFKHKPLRQFTPREYSVSLEGVAFQVDGGVTYRVDALVPMPGSLRLGAAVYDVLDRGWGFAEGGESRLPFLNDIIDGAATEGRVDPGAEQRARERFRLDRSYRVGVAYEVPRLFFLENVGVAADVQGYEQDVQPLLARLHVGTRATLVGPLRFRAGVSAGYPSGGLGLALGALHLDYSVHGVEEGQQFRQRGAYVHTARMMVRLD